MMPARAAAVVVLILLPRVTMAGSKPGDLSLEPITLRAANGREIQAERGRLLVPENRSKPESNLIEVAFVRLKSFSPTPGTPLVYLTGGPGASATASVRNAAALSIWAPFLEHADVILIDQRGVGACKPTLLWQPDMPVPTDVFRDRDSFVRSSKDFCGRMVQHFRDQGIDLTGYTVVEMADDVNDVRAALKFPKISLLGFSFGTHHALTIVRRHGQFIDRAVLVGTEGPNHTRKLPSTYERQLETISKLVSQDERVNKDVPDFAALVRRVLEKLDREPMTVSITERGRVVELPIGRWGLQIIMIIDFGDTSDLPVFPRLVHSIDQGDPSILSWFVQKRYAQFRQLSAVFWVCDAASGATQQRWKQIGEEAKSSTFDNAMNMAFPEIDEVFGTPDLGDGFRASITSDVPTLFISGSLDSNTPPWQAEEVARGFSNATLLVVENAGHEDMLPDPEVQQTIRRFLRGEQVKDVQIAQPQLRFIPIAGTDPNLTHPSLH